VKKTKTHTGQLLDRFVTPSGGLRITVQTDRGPIEEVRVAPEFRDQAAAIWGRGSVRYQYRGGKAFFCPADEEPADEG